MLYLSGQIPEGDGDEVDIKGKGSCCLLLLLADVVEDDIDKFSMECATLVVVDLIVAFELIVDCGGGDTELNLGEV